MNSRWCAVPDLVVWSIGVGFLCLFAARASEAGTSAGAAAADVWREECGACHIAYAPRLLPAASWRLLLEQLDRHFGVNASLEPDRAAAILSYLDAQAAPADRAPIAAGLPRISQLPWFEREHAEVPADVWRRSSVRSRSNCGACHIAAGKGIFDEHEVRIPR